MPTIERVEEHAGVTVEQVIADGAFGSGQNRAACAEQQAPASGPGGASGATPRSRSAQVGLPHRHGAARRPPAGSGPTRLPPPQTPPVLACPPGDSASPGRPAWSLPPASNAASRARPPDAWFRPPTPMRRICRPPASVGAPDEFQIEPIGCAHRSNAGPAELVDHGLRNTPLPAPARSASFQRLWQRRP